MSGTNLPLSGERLWQSLMEMARIGGTAKGGCNRQTLTAEDGEGRALLARWGREIGLTLTTDRLGNMALRREGRDPSRRPVAIGSHLDTQPTGGKFDGVLGVLAGLEVMRALHEAGVETEAPLLLINWTNEEGARFSPPMMGSGGAMGLFTEAEVLNKTDAAGTRFGDALQAIGWAGEADPASLRDLEAYFELHIEQGPALERDGLEIGIVTHALAQHWFEVTVRGEDAHAGGGMAHRRDALVAAAELVTAVEEIALASGGDARGTVGVLRVVPSSRNVVPSETWFSVDFRHGSPEALEGMGDALRERAAAVAARRGVAVEVESFWYSPHTPFDPALTDRLREAAGARGLRMRDMPTGIGHDAVYVAQTLPAGFLFVPCHGGISHNERESITPEWAAAGTAVLADAVLATAGIAKD
ncbi:Zn-dependent hydrolase [Roseomonas elaeocarpi]|uniref:Zn-dependent hydrolase n=1 Tax=Roseomonas elaeocarpi TaxID=907779 RepID=A0ABV6JXJ5_9PROT